MAAGSSKLVRDVAYAKYVEPAIRAGHKTISIPVKDLMLALRPSGFPSTSYNQICSSIQAAKFVAGNHLRVVRVDGPPSGKSSTVVMHYERLPEIRKSEESPAVSGSALPESPSEKADRLINSLRGKLKGVFDEFGGPEGFIRWVRGYDEEETEIPEIGAVRK